MCVPVCVFRLQWSQCGVAAIANTAAKKRDEYGMLASWDLRVSFFLLNDNCFKFYDKQSFRK